jgi:hypothetical protein
VTTEDGEPDGARSSFKLEIALSIGYQRRRDRIAGKWEGSIVSLVLLVGGTVIAVFVVYTLFTRLLGQG